MALLPQVGRVSPARVAMVNALQSLKEAFHQVNARYEDLDDRAKDAFAYGYPFEHSFDEVTANVDEWRDEYERIVRA